MKTAALLAFALVTCVPEARVAVDERDPAALIGTWRGTSTCTDRVAAPACRDEIVVYDFTAGPKAGTVHWKADKVVDGKREPMGELDLKYDPAEKCWLAEFGSPRPTVVWCLAVDGTRLTGTGRLVPGRETVRRIEARKEGTATGRDDHLSDSSRP